MNAPYTELVITFGEALFPDPAVDLLNWSVRHNNTTWDVTAAAVSGSVVTLTGFAGLANPGANVVSFAPPPFDVITSLSGLPVLPFADYPVT